MQNEKSGASFVTALARGLCILQCFNSKQRLLGTTELAALARLPQPTVWRLCKTLQDLGYLVMAPGTEKLRLGPAAIALGAAAISGQEALEVARPYLQRLADKYRAAVALGVRDGDSIVYVSRCQGPSPLLMNLRVGSRIPLHRSAIGLAYVASGEPQERIDARLALQAQNRPLDEFDDAMDYYDRHRYVIHVRPHQHINTVGAAIQGPERYVVSCGGPASSLPLELLQESVGPELLEMSQELASIFKLGGGNE